VTNSRFRAPLLALGFCAMAYGQTAAPPSKVGIINIQQAILQTKDGQKAAADLNAKFEPKSKEMERKQGELQTMQTQYRSGANTMSDEAKQKLARDIDQRAKLLKRDQDDAQAELEAEQGRIWQELGQKLMSVVDRYASERGFALILDVSSPQTPVLYASNTIDITRDVVGLYDGGHTGAATPAAAPTGAATGNPSGTGGLSKPTPPASAPKPAAAAPKK
jgi:outer membrane protein